MTTLSIRARRYIAIAILAATVILSVIASILIIQNWQYVRLLERQGYIGLFLVAVLAGSPLPVPTPNIILTFTLGGVLNPLLVAVVSSVGNTVGNALIYYMGRGGFVFFKNLGLTRKSKDVGPTWFDKVLVKLKLHKIREFTRKRVLFAVFILGMYPNPLLFTVVMGMGASRYPFWKFFLVCWAGKFVEAIVLSYLGYFGLRGFLTYFGVPA